MVIAITAGNDAHRGCGRSVSTGSRPGTCRSARPYVPGRHLIQVGKRGFLTFSQWVDLESGQVLELLG